MAKRGVAPSRRSRDDDSEERGSRRAASRGSGGKKEGGVSFRRDDAISVGLWQGGECTASHIYGMFNYKERGRHPALIVTFTDTNGEQYEEPYGVGSGWEISSDGTELIPKQGQTGLPNSCDAILHYLGPLEDALKAAGLDDGMPDGSDITQLDGIRMITSRHPATERNFKEDRSRRNRRNGEDEDSQQPKKTKLQPDEVLEVPWGEGNGASEKRGGKAARSSDEAQDDAEQEESPRGKASSAGSRGAKRGAKEEPAEEENGGADTDDIDEQAIETLIEMLEDESPRKQDELTADAKTFLKGNKDAKAIAARLGEDELLEQEQGWVYNARRGTVELKK